MKTLSPNQINALRLLHRYTSGRMAVWLLTGQENAGIRAEIMSEISGTKIPKSQARIGKLEDALHDLVGASGDCLATKCHDFVIKAMGHINSAA